MERHNKDFKVTVKLEPMKQRICSQSDVSQVLDWAIMENKSMQQRLN